ncbi:hypothetical protein [Streptomyces niveus]|uniref:hypothetical protein n=1 Tax=Streptomyces niveus TaxID=193462 RepID=UPI003692DAC8
MLGSDAEAAGDLEAAREKSAARTAHTGAEMAYALSGLFERRDLDLILPMLRDDSLLSVPTSSKAAITSPCS